MADVAHHVEAAPGALGVITGEEHGGSAQLCHALPLHSAVSRPLWVDTLAASPTLAALSSADAWASDGRWEHHDGEWCMRAAMAMSLYTAPSLSLGVKGWAGEDGGDM